MKYLVSEKLLNDNRIDSYCDLMYYIKAYTIMKRDNCVVEYDLIDEIEFRLEELGYVKHGINLYLQKYLEEYHEMKQDMIDGWCEESDMQYLKKTYAELFQKRRYGVKIIQQPDDTIITIETHNLEKWLRDYYNDNQGRKYCTVCGDSFTPTSNRQKYCIKCKEDAERKATMMRVRKYRSKF